MADSVATNWDEESPGVKSSKRLLGGLTLILGLVMKSALFVVCLLPDVALAHLDLADTLSTAVCIIGASLLGVTILDVFKKATV